MPLGADGDLRAALTDIADAARDPTAVADWWALFELEEEVTITAAHADRMSADACECWDSLGSRLRPQTVALLELLSAL